MTRLTGLDELAAALAGSTRRPALIFKHSPACGRSAYAHDEVIDLLNGGAVHVDVYLVDVLTGRAVSDAIARRLDVRHESPQVLLVVDGRVRWHASHFGVTALAIRSAVERGSGPTQSEPGR